MFNCFSQLITYIQMNPAERCGFKATIAKQTEQRQEIKRQYRNIKKDIGYRIGERKLFVSDLRREVQQKLEVEGFVVEKASLPDTFHIKW